MVLLSLEEIFLIVNALVTIKHKAYGQHRFISGVFS